MTIFASDTGQPQEPKAPPRSARRRAREFVMQGLYQWRVGGADEAAIEAYAPEMEGFAKADREFLRRHAARRHRPARKADGADRHRTSTARSPISRRSKPAS
jgi:transcription termination factor NusB